MLTNDSIVKIVCPSCGAKEGENDPDFGFFPVCSVRPDIDAWCYKCNHTFEYKNNRMKNKFKNFKWSDWILLPFLWGGPLGLIITLCLIGIIICAIFCL